MKIATMQGILVVTAVSVVVLTPVGCSADKTAVSSSAQSAFDSSKPAASSTAASSLDYTTLLISASDIQAPGDRFSGQGAPILNPGGQDGVSQAFTNQAGDRVIGDTIVMLADPSSAATALEKAKGSLSSSVEGTPTSANVGSNGLMMSGNSPDGSKSVTVVLFTEGKAFATLQFESGPSDPVPPEFATDVAAKQDAAIKKALPV
jgi:hypothetical protein